MTAANVGAAVGCVLMVVVVWFAYGLIRDLDDDPLEFRERVAIERMRSRLPIEISDGFFVNRFDVRSNKLVVGFWVPDGIANQSRPELAERVVNWLCILRERMQESRKVEIEFSIVGKEKEAIFETLNRHEDCENRKLTEDKLKL